MKATIRLTPSQVQSLKPLFDAVADAMNRTSLDLSRDERGSILGQVWGYGVKKGVAEFYWLNNQQAREINRAIKRAKIADTGFATSKLKKKGEAMNEWQPKFQRIAIGEENEQP